MDCLVCGSVSWIRYLEKGEHRYVRCVKCDVVRLDPFPTDAQARSLYGDGYFTDASNAGYDDYCADEAVHRRNGRRRVERLGPVPAATNVLVDVGCAFGFTMLEARNAGWDPRGVEANSSARRAVRAAGMSCEATFDALELPPGSVGAVSFFQVLEHLPDPLQALRAAREALAPGGKVCIETWDRSSRVARLAGRRWQQASPPSVLWLLNEPSMAAMAHAAGLELQAHSRSTKWVTLGLVAGQMRDRGARGPLARVAAAAGGVAVPYFLDDLVAVSLVKSGRLVGGPAGP
ncbi:MAG: class I SAM-dependent methyltransferase [Acidimicrobiia bacterium]|nr:class I SAM-dependent methyltransferase [Acidimicrobiia bacterium]